MTISQITGSVGGVVLTSATYADPITVTATGKVSGGMSAATWWAIDNAGTIAAASAGVYLADGGSVTNVFSGLIDAFSTVNHGGAGVRVAGSAGTVDNFGSIATSNPGGDGVSLSAGGMVINRAVGSITATYDGVGLENVSAAIDNYGYVKGGRTGIDLRPGGSVTNALGGAISGGLYGVLAEGAHAAVENAGTISGGTDAIKLSATLSNRLIVDAGAVFNGEVVATNATSVSTLELTAKNGAGTLSGLGSAFLGFQTIGIDSSAAWTIKGARAGFHGVTIAGLNGHDGLDLTDLAFAAGDTVTLNGATDVLTIRNSGGTALANVQLAGSFTGDTFKVTNDGAGGTGITLLTLPKFQITGSYAAGITLTGAAYTNPVTVTSTGYVGSVGKLQYGHGATYGISAAVNWSLSNYGHIYGYKAGVTLAAGGAVTNHGSIGANGSIYNYTIAKGVEVKGGSGRVDNFGSISGEEAVGLYAGGVVTNEAGGSISGAFGITIVGNGGVFNAAGASIYGTEVGVRIDGTGTVYNFGTITTVYLPTSGLIVNASGATITGGEYLFGIQVHNGKIENAGSIRTGVYMTGVTATLENSGVISPSNPTYRAVRLDAKANTYVVDPGTQFHSAYGVYVNRTAANTLELASAARAGTWTGGFGSFQTIKIDPGATWTVAAGHAAFNGVTIAGFGQHDILDLTDLTFEAVYKATLNSATDVLTVYNSGHTTLGTVQLSGNFTGYAFAVSHDGATGTDIALVNALKSQITGTYTSGVTLTSAIYPSPVTVTATGKISGGVSAAAQWSIDNYGSISGTNVGIYLQAGGLLMNAAPGVIVGQVRVAGAAGTVVNAGSISGTSASMSAISLRAGGSVTNAASGTIVNRIFGVLTENGLGTVDNSGMISGGFKGVYMVDGFVTNAALAHISGGGFGVRILSGSPSTVNNYGTIIGRKGVVIGNGIGGSVTNHGLVINHGSAAIIAGGPGAGNYGAIAGTVENWGVIESSTGGGVNAGSVTNVSGGTIAGAVYGIVAAGANSTVENAGTIRGNTVDGVRANGPATVLNAGVIVGRKDAVYFDAAGANRLIIDAGAVFHGVVDAVAGGRNVIELASTPNAGTLSGLGSEYLGFQTVTIDTGAAWTVKGAKAGFVGVTLAGLNTHDTLDLTDLAFTAGDKATLNSATDVLTISTAGGTTIDTLQLAGSFAGYAFNVASNGAGGMNITLKATGAAIPANRPAAPASSYRQMAQLIQAVAMDRSTLSAFAQPTALYRPHDSMPGGSLASARR